MKNNQVEEMGRLVAKGKFMWVVFIFGLAFLAMGIAPYFLFLGRLALAFYHSTLWSSTPVCPSFWWFVPCAIGILVSCLSAIAWDNWHRPIPLSDVGTTKVQIALRNADPAYRDLVWKRGWITGVEWMALRADYDPRLPYGNPLKLM